MVYRFTFPTHAIIITVPGNTLRKKMKRFYRVPIIRIYGIPSQQEQIRHVKRDLAFVGQGVQPTQEKKHHRKQQKESVYRPLNCQRTE